MVFGGVGIIIEALPGIVHIEIRISTLVFSSLPYRAVVVFKGSLIRTRFAWPTSPSESEKGRVRSRVQGERVKA